MITIDDKLRHKLVTLLEDCIGYSNNGINVRLRNMISELEGLGNNAIVKSQPITFTRERLHEVIECLGDSFGRYTIERHIGGKARIELLDGRYIEEFDNITKTHAGEIIIHGR